MAGTDPAQETRDDLQLIFDAQFSSSIGRWVPSQRVYFDSEKLSSLQVFCFEDFGVAAFGD